MFYTKYRPQKFSEISRPNEAADALSKQVSTNKTVHAYLFVGPRGTGKTSTARILAKSLNCSKLSKDGDPCDKCEACVAIREGTFLDLIEIDAASNRGIDDIRELKNKVRLAPVMGKNKIYIIDEVHMLTSEAFNALLKTLEEPPKNVMFILCTTELHKVPDTIKSRCQVFKFKRATVQQIVSKLENISKVEKIEVTKSDLERIARASMGGFRDAETLLQQISEGEIKAEALLSTGSWEDYIEFVDYLLAKDPASAIKLVNKLYEEGVDLYVWCGDLLKYLRDLLLVKSGVSADFLEVTAEALTEITSQTSRIQTSQLIFILDNFIKAYNNTKTNVISQLPIEIAIVQVCGYDNSETVVKSAPNTNPKVTPTAPVKKSETKTDKEPEKEEEVKDNKAVEDLTETLTDLTVSISEVAADSDADEPQEAIIELDLVKEKWTALIEKMNDLNRSLLALLKASKPMKIEGKSLVLEVFYAFHKERLESPKNRKLVENALKDIMNVELNLKCFLSDDKPAKLKSNEVGVLTDMNIMMPSGPQIVDKSAVLGMLDGELPL
ncbi:DNA polymerase III, subunit gamma and tau [candidate division WWE3 bacterium RIFOXYC1_FULL_39_7]|uniref:DNA polymerase III subunit gamma/tau n=2 Tax=Katanobacteria TaxID=422282 RepID=A0A1F4X7E9_UNCKA|nr:MAG: DNA polymerase III, subunit gamma and tau [candidate division WWE3 bacterium RIFOXYC1_FULL_39_7]OGC77597.1 MAG: DNA polymerase III, subunit gamma and tau [candidate division WWE3 bacterium RIFOXYD1_FULL_39_9]